MATEVLPDEKALRYGRRARAFGEMEAHDLDVLILGRTANVRYMSGAPQLWNAGTRPFGPTCVAVRATQEIHLVSTWDEGIPEEIPHANLFGITWNPMNFLTWLQGIDGGSDARRVGTDSLSPLFAQLLPTAFPSAALVDGGQAMEAARRIKTAEEVAAIRASLDVAESALAATLADLAPGVAERELTGVFMEAMALHGVTTPSTQDVVTITSPRDARAPKGEERVRAGDLVAFTAGVVDSGYTGEVGRTWSVAANGETAGHNDLHHAWDELWGRLLEACQPGSTGADLLAAYDAAGVAVPAIPVARGLGLGLDVPVVLRDLPATAKEQRLDPGVVLAITAMVESDLGKVVGQEVVVITHDGAEVLSSSPFWNH